MIRRPRSESARRAAPRGYTLIELMVAIAVIGVLTTVAAPEFMEYIRRAKASEARLQMSSFTRKLKIYYTTNLELPQGISDWLPVPGLVGACPNKHAVSTAWAADPIYSALGFSVDERSRENFLYIGFGAVAVLYTFFDYDCDGIVTGNMVTYEVLNGNITATESYDIFGPD
jgi:prepilin-type N-terminal cleavage/methylation domain-containing protein